ncbi:MAG: hypothetical protein IIV99_07060, partial [Oscillospiraceae bacterium]|nr:hypothetical protein [Oscillospiraceae bacterium]
GEEVGFDDYSNGVEVSSYSDMFHFIVYGWDFDSTIDVKNIKVSFSPEYSARLLGLPADAWKTNEQVVSMKLPVAVDEEGNLIRNADGTYPAWENLGTGNNGIYRTKVLAAEDPDGGYPGYFEVEVWGTWIYSEEVDADGNPISYDMYPESQAVMFEVSDVYGNVGQTSREYGYRNPFYNISAWTPYTEGDYKGFLNIDKSINADGTVGIVHSVPLASIDGYGIKVTNEDAYTAGQTQHMYYTTSPMITDDGEYIIKVIDLFGNEYEIPVYIDGFGEFGIDVVFSETDMTNRDVKVNVFSTGEFDDIVSITASNGTKGTINKQNPLTGEITVSENCAVTIKTKSGAERTVQVANIDKSLDKTDIIYYDQSYNVYTADTKNVSEITAVLSCKTEFVFAINGDSSYTFPEGSKKGDTYTFEVSDNAGNIKNIVATCPCDIPVKTQQPADTTAPELVVTAYAEQEETIKLISSVRNPDLTNSDGTGINDAINSVRAQSVRMAFTVEDTSAVKVFAVPAGSDAPKYSSQQGSTVENVELSVNDVTAIITVKENAEFDLYFVDQAGNTTSYKTIKVGKIDYTAPVL